MRGVYAKVLTAGLIVLAASPAFAQRPPGAGGFGPPGMGQGPTAAMLLANDKVQQELKITDDEKAAIKKATDEVNAKYKDDLDKARAGMDRQKMGELRKAMSEESEKAVLAVLKPDQSKRLKQIQVQTAGLGAFSKEDVQTALKLTDAQKKDIKDATDDMQKDVQELFQNARGDRDKFAEAQKKIQTLREETLDSIVKNLTDDQKKTWKELTGDKFEVTLAPGGFGGVGAGFGPPGGTGGFGPPGGFGGGFGFGPGRGGTGALLRMDKVQEELKISDSQKTDIKAASDKVQEKYKDDMDKARADMDFQKMQELGRQQNEDLEKALGTVLKPDQSKRLKQIQVQVAGLQAFSRDDVQSALKLTDAQKKDVKDTVDGVQKDIQEAFQGAFGDRDKMAEAQKKVQTLRTDAMDKIVRGLTDDQKKTWKDLNGEKFDLPAGPGGFGPPGGRPPGGNPPNPGR
jgi:hypothetical protein